jgi:lysophospholipase L1-like esterase
LIRKIGAGAVTVLRGLRTAWDVAGATLLLTVIVVIALLAVRALTGSGEASEDRADHPYRNEPWFDGYAKEFDASLQMQWEPYVYWRRRPISGSYVNVDSAGSRRTVQPGPAGSTPRRLFFFGGSTMWGTGQRDAWTIPSRVAAGLAANGVDDVEITNFGETGYVFTQELIKLQMVLRKGARPDVVVFYDGINDVASSAMSPECGLPQNETRRAFEFALGRFLVQRTTRDLGGVIQAARARVDRKPGGTHGPGPTPLDTAAVANGIVDCYARTASFVEMLSRAHGFRVLYFWQPTPGTSPKPLTPFEVAAVDTTSAEPIRQLLQSLHRRAAAQMDSAMKPVAGDRFLNLAGLFSGDKEPVWLDYIGHITERASGQVADSMLPTIMRALQAKPVAAGR